MNQTLMKLTNRLSLILFLISVGTTVTMAQQSDYQIIQDFREGYQSLLENIEEAEESDDLDQISSQITALESEYQDNSELINSAIYPDTFSARVATLKERFRIVQQSLNEIGQLNDRIIALTEEVESYERQLDELDRNNARLLSEIEASENNEERLSQLLTTYRQNLQERDRFVTAFLEELLNRYTQMDVSTVEELSESATRLQETPVELIETILGEYINQTQQEASLQTVDFLRMKAQYVYFQDVWFNIGERLTTLFVPEASVQAEQTVTDLLNRWNSGIEERLWNNLDTSFDRNGIDLDGFSSQQEFHESLISYIDEATTESRNVNTEADYRNFQNFVSFWNEQIKAEWGDLLMSGNILTYPQMSDVDQKLEEWNEAALPVSNLMLILFLISIVIIVGLVVLLIRKR